MGKLKFNADESLILVDAVLVGNIEGQEFIVKLALDTGAALTTISQELMRYLGYDPEHSAYKGTIITVNGNEQVPVVTVKKITIGNESVENVEAFCHSFPKERYVDGVIGMNFLKKFNAKIDFDKGEVTLDRRG
jgi:clan AA aspartic protease (TIGR02281 family)